MTPELILALLFFFSAAVVVVGVIPFMVLPAIKRAAMRENRKKAFPQVLPKIGLRLKGCPFPLEDVALFFQIFEDVWVEEMDHPRRKVRRRLAFQNHRLWPSVDAGRKKSFCFPLPRPSPAITFPISGITTSERTSSISLPR